MAEVEIVEKVLGNGLKIIAERNLDAKSAAIGFFVKTGSRDETQSESGISHFLEHMMFKGTEKRSALDITYELGNLAVKANAYTSDEATVYYGAVLPEYFSRYQELLSDMLKPALDPKEFDMEKKVILEEIALYKDRPSYCLFEKAFRSYFNGHPSGNSVLGSVESVSAITRDDMLNYYKRRYSPSNMVLIAAGNFDLDRFMHDAERLCGGWKSFETERKVEPYEGKEESLEFTKSDIQQAHIMILTGGPSQQDPHRYAFGVFSNIVGDVTGSRYYWALVNSGIAESADSEVDEKDGTGCFISYACCPPDNIDKVSGILNEILDSPLQFTDKDMERAKAKIATRMVLGGELPMGRMRALGHEWLAREKVHNLHSEVEAIMAVSRKDIESALSAYPLTKRSEYRLLPA
ncbi:MAG: insulinase family protein [Candidatus Dadabacteria bacterium]|nr:MAG: insulinase family protein [Candidatus Dadabacteria bacterium]